MAGKTFKMPPLAPKAKFVPPTIDFESGSAGAEVSFTCRGLKSLEANLLSMPKIAVDAAGYEMADIAKEVIEDAQENFVPVDTGALKQSGDYDEYEPGKGIGIAHIAMWFGGVVGPEALEHGVIDVQAYALEQHENMEYRHNIGGPKYLERPFMKAMPTILPRIAEAIDKAMGGNNVMQIDITSGPKV